jgi:hypothetical protein
MDLATIEMPVEEAKERLEEYRRSLQDDRNRQDERIAAGYRWLARGNPIIKLSESIQRGGFFDNGLPRIAIARANGRDCTVRYESWTDSFIYSIEAGDWHRNLSALVNKTTVRVALPEPPSVAGKRAWHGRTIMPLIPPKHRPKPRRLHWFHILWEVEKWDLIPPKDPALLRWIAGDLWAVAATWDLTELERAVLQR